MIWFAGVMGAVGSPRTTLRIGVWRWRFFMHANVLGTAVEYNIPVVEVGTIMLGLSVGSKGAI